ncbi:MAG: UDP-glucose 4-epimerase GalE [Cyclobacteriaceae bacterium]|jgi:UDP-glucose 4-epimerase
MKILVTGGTGYIGSHTVVELQQQGFEVFIIDNLSNSRAEIAEQIAKITGKKPDLEVFDLTDKQKTKAFFRKHHDLAGVVHFAASKAVGESVEKPLMYYKNNLGSLVNVLEGMIENGILNFVFSSSCTVYGQPDELPVSESAPIKPAESPYGNTKQISEEILKDTIDVTKLKAIALRYFNPIGAHESAKIGELPQGVPNNLVPYITQTANGIRDYLRVWGNDYNTHDGTAVRDYIHVMDLAKAHVVAIRRMIDSRMKQDFEVFNLGTGTGYSVMDVIKAFERVTGMQLNFKIMDRREGDIEKVWADPAYSNKELGWKAEKGIEEMMDSAWKWELAYRKNLKS